MKSIYWNLYDNGKLVGRYTTTEICRMTGCARGTVHNNAIHGFTYKNRWKFVRTELQKSIEELWEEERFKIRWDCARLILLGKIEKIPGSQAIRIKRSDTDGRK